MDGGGVRGGRRVKRGRFVKITIANCDPENLGRLFKFKSGSDRLWDKKFFKRIPLESGRLSFREKRSNDLNNSWFMAGVNLTYWSAVYKVVNIHVSHLMTLKSTLLPKQEELSWNIDEDFLALWGPSVIIIRFIRWRWCGEHRCVWKNNY